MLSTAPSAARPPFRPQRSAPPRAPFGQAVRCSRRHCRRITGDVYFVDPRTGRMARQALCRECYEIELARSERPRATRTRFDPDAEEAM